MRGVFYGWWIVAAGGVVQGYASATFWRGFAAFFGPIVDTFGWSSGATAGAMSLQRTEGGMISPFVGTIINRFGPRRVMAVGIAITGTSFILMSQVQSLWQFYATMALLTVGMSFGTFIVLVSTVSNWFVKKRSKALAILMACTGVGGFFVPVLVLSIDTWGWREVLLSVGVGFWIVGFPAAYFMRTRPEDYGQMPDGVAAIDEATGRPVVIREPDFTVRQVMKTRFFWQFSIAASFGQLVSSTNLFHITALESFDVSLKLASLAILMVAVGDFAGRLGIGALSTKYDNRILFAGAFGIQAIGTLALTLTHYDVFGFTLPLYLTLPFFALGFGVGFGSSIPLRLSMLADYFGRRNYASVVGITSTVSAGFGAVGPVAVGLSFDLTGTYRWGFLVLGMFLIAAIPITLALERPGRVAAKLRRGQTRARAKAALDTQAQGDQTGQ